MKAAQRCESCRMHRREHGRRADRLRQKAPAQRLCRGQFAVVPSCRGVKAASADSGAAVFDDPLASSADVDQTLRMFYSWSKVLETAGLDDSDGKVTPHIMRHSRATWLMQAGIDPWEAAGHLGMNVGSRSSGSPYDAEQDKPGHARPAARAGARAALRKSNRHQRCQNGTVSAPTRNEKPIKLGTISAVADVIHEGKIRAPAAAVALIERLK